MPSYTFTIHTGDTELTAGAIDDIALTCNRNETITDWYLQTEETNGNHHLHVVLSLSTDTGYGFREAKKQIVDTTKNYAPVPPEAVKIKRNRNGSARQCDFETFVGRYLLNKLKEGNGRWILARAKHWDAENERERAQRAMEGGENRTQTDGTTHLTTAGSLFREQMTICVEKGITTQEKLKQQEPAIYYNLLASGKTQQMKTMLEAAKGEILDRYPLGHFLQGKEQTETPTNWITDILTKNGINTDTFCLFLYRWSNKETGKTNTLMLKGPANTGKTTVAAAIAGKAPWYANVNQTNENFAFGDCHETPLIWWEECAITERTVELAKSIMGGQAIKTDKKGTAQRMIDHTPVIVTTNHNIGIVKTGNGTTTIHQEAILTRCFPVDLNYRLTTDNFDYPGQEEKEQAVEECYMWGKHLNGREVDRDTDRGEGTSSTRV